MADGRHLEKSKNSNISATFRPIGVKCGAVMHIYLFSRIVAEFLKIQGEDGRHFDNSYVQDFFVPVVVTFCTKAR